MSRVTRLGSPHVRRVFGLALTLTMLATSLGTAATAQERPPCGPGQTVDCRLPDWSEAPTRDIPSLFGEIDGLVWVDDPSGDAPAAGLDILGVGLGRVDIADPAPIRTADDLLKLGKAKKAVPSGEAVLVRIVLDRGIDQAGNGHASVHLATDINGSRSSNVPSGVGAPDFPFSGSQDLYSVTWASTTGKTRLLQSDLAKGWYEAKEPFAASWAAPDVLDLLVAPEAMGEDFRVITHTNGRDGGYDTASLGPAAIPVGGRVGLVPTCIEGSISTTPHVVRRLTENGQTVRDVEAPASWRGGASVPVNDDIRARLDSLIGARDEDGDGRIGILTWVNLFEDGIVIRQRPDLEVALEGDHALLAVELGLTRRGYSVVRDFEPKPTGDAQLDAWLERATDALRETMPPFRLARKPGLLIGDEIGACIPWLEPSPLPAAQPSSSPADPGAAASA